MSSCPRRHTTNCKTPITLIACCIGVFICIQISTADELIRYQSPDGFSVIYPSSWHRFGSSVDWLQIINSSTRENGVIIPRGAAAITVKKLKNFSEMSFLDYARKDENPIIGQDFSENSGTGNDYCKSMQEILQEIAISETKIMMRDSMYCMIDQKCFSASVIYWRDDGPNKNNIDLTRTILKSLRLAS